MRKKIAVGILGATGTVGRQLVKLLTTHPWFKVTTVAASANSAGKLYAESISWQEPTALPRTIGTLKIKKCGVPLAPKILFSSLDTAVAGEIEEYYASNGHIVISNSKNHRLNKDIPLIIPEINSNHLQLIKKQKTTGCIITNPNCSAIILAIALFPIFKKFGLTKVIATTMQAVSGAGHYGLPAMDILGNIIPHIPGETEKIQQELPKIFGTYKGGKLTLARCKISASCNRVPVSDGHTISVSFATQKRTTESETIKALLSMPSLNLPSSPPQVIKYFADDSHPQPLLDVNIGHGMTVTIGNLRRCPVLDWKFTILGHNTIRGGAGAAILNAELIVAKGY